MVAVEENFGAGDTLDREYKTPKTRNNYKGDSVASATVRGEDRSKVELVSGAFRTKVTAVRRRSSMTRGLSGSSVSDAQSLAAAAAEVAQAEESRLAEAALAATQAAELVAQATEEDRLAEEARIAAEIASAELEAEQSGGAAVAAGGAAVVVDSTPKVPTPGFVLKCLTASGDKVFVNVCGHFDVSDAVSTQGVEGCPFIICIAANPEVIGVQSGGVQVYHAVMHPKYVFAAMEDPSGIQLKVSATVD